MLSKIMSFNRNKETNKKTSITPPGTSWPGSTGPIFSVKCDWLAAHCEVSLSTQMLSDTLRDTSLTITSLQEITPESNLCNSVQGEMD